MSTYDSPIGKLNRFGSKTYDPFSQVNDDFNRIFRDGKKASPPMPTTKTCTACDQRRPMLGSTTRGGRFVCRGCK